MQAYSQAFARIYNARWSDFARYVAALILDFYATTPTGQENRAVLDPCRGTGQLAVHFLEAGYRVVGDDGGEDVLIITRGICDGQSDRAWTRISGFVRRDDGRYARFQETAFNTVFEMERVKEALLEVGYGDAYFARVQDLGTPIAEPEEEGRAFIVASK